MMGRRTAAMLCVLFGHALLVLALRDLTRPDVRAGEDEADVFVTQIIPLISSDEQDLPDLPEPTPQVVLASPLLPQPGEVPGEQSPAMDSGAITTQGFIDWPQEGRDAAARVLAREAEAERIAKMFAGPNGTWASLTKRQQSELSRFRWKPGIDGLERDAKGNTTYQFKNGCTLVNFVFIGCPIGAKQPAYGDLFKDMRLYFDEQRLPRTDEGNGREPESLRPPKWSKPLE